MLNLMDLRKEKNISRYRLAKLSGLRESTIRSAELENENPRFLTVKKICDALNVDINKVKEVAK